MTKENETHLDQQILRHFKLLKRGTILAGGAVSAILLPLIALVWSMNVSIIKLEQKTDNLDINKLNQTEAYDNFLNKGQYIFLEGERIKCQQDVIDGVDVARSMTEWGKTVNEALGIRYRGGREIK